MGEEARAKKRVKARRGEGRAQILRAATRAFSLQGYKGATTAGIARAAGVTQPLVHHHFGSKQKLWDAVMAEIFTSLEAYLSGAMAQTVDAAPIEQLKAMLRAFVRFSGRHPELARLLALESANQSDNFDSFFDAHVRPRWAQMRAIIEGAIGAGVLRPDISLDLAPFMIVGASVHLFVAADQARKQGLDPFDPEVIDRYADQVVDILFRGLKAPD